MPITSVSVGGGGGGIGVGPFASLPAVPAVGDVYFPTDKNWEYRCGTAGIWQAYRKNVPITPPFAANFTYIRNAGTTSTKTDTAGGMLLTKGYQNGYSLLAQNAALPSAPWTLEMGFVPNLIPLGSNSSGTGLALAETNAKWETLNSLMPATFNATAVAWAKFDPNFNTLYTGRTFQSMFYETWIRIVNDGTNLTGYFSQDGSTWVLFSTHTATSFLASIANFAIFMEQEAEGSQQSVSTVFHWKVTS